MSFENITTANFLEQMKIVIPEWNITTVPDDFLENASKYHNVEIILSKGKIIRKCNLSAKFSEKPPTNYQLLAMNIASQICDETQNDEIELFEKLVRQVFKFMEKTKEIKQK